jgi:Ca2+-transporting ATPase
MQQTLQYSAHAQSISSLSDALRTNAFTGISEKEARERLQNYGENILTLSKGPSAWKIIVGQFSNILILILLGGAALSAFLGHEGEAIAIAVIVLFAVILGFVQEFRAEKALHALKAMASPQATVKRDGRDTVIPASLVVPGDVILLVAGSRVPADARVIESFSIKSDEAALTGESVPVEKHAENLPEETPLGDRRNLLFSGTSVTYGRGMALVYATGMSTEFGKIAGMLSEVETEETPLQQELERLGKNLARLAGVIVLIVCGLGLFRGEPLLEMLIFGIALAVAAVPEALPAVVTISLAIGVQRMTRRHALVRRLPAVETLGCATAICSDKTGTLTKDEMTARQIYVDGRILDVTGSGYEPVGRFEEEGNSVERNSSLHQLLRAAVLCSDARLQEEDGAPSIVGDPTEGALVVAAAKAGFAREILETEEPRTEEVPFTSETKRMITMHKTTGGSVAYMKGALESILPFCSHVQAEHGTTELTTEQLRHIETVARGMGEEALRVLAVAKKVTDQIGTTPEAGWVFLGLFGLMDPPREEAKAAMETCKKAGIRVRMITGDHPITATAIAKELSLLRPQGSVITGIELDKMSDEDLRQKIHHIDVFARVSPAHKLRIVEMLQSQGEVVAMTGDGVNDAPALKKADIGIAMGINGTDVSRESASVILTDDNFASIVAAIEEGRIIFGNIKKYLLYLLSSNIGEIFLMLGATIIGLPLPLSAVQILYVNLATDGLPALALALDPPEPGLMNAAPRKPGSSIFTKPRIGLILLSGTWATVINLGVFLWALHSGRGEAEAMSMAFISLVLVQFWNAYIFRSDTASTFKNPFANKWLNFAVLWEIVLLIVVVEVPFFNRFLGTFPLPQHDWIIVLLAAVTIVPVMELAKFIVRRRAS